MKKRIKKRKLGRDRAHRKALLSNMASSLILSEYIVTTEAKAKTCKQHIEKLISKGKRDPKHASRYMQRVLKDPLASQKIIEVLVKRFEDRNGGYTKIVKIKRRKGDNAKLVKLFFVGSEIVREKKKVRVKKSEKKETKKKAEKEQAEKKGGVLGKVKALRSKITSQRDDQKLRKEERKRTTGQAGVQKTRSGI